MWAMAVSLPSSNELSLLSTEEKTLLFFRGGEFLFFVICFVRVGCDLLVDVFGPAVLFALDDQTSSLLSQSKVSPAQKWMKTNMYELFHVLSCLPTYSSLSVIAIGSDSTTYVLVLGKLEYWVCLVKMLLGAALSADHSLEQSAVAVFAFIVPTTCVFRKYVQFIS